MNLRKPQLAAFLGALCYVLMAGIPALADDTEIFAGSTGSNTAPNVVFIIDTSGSMGSTVSGGRNPTVNDPSRLEEVKGVFRALINSPGTSGINMAVMRFDNRSNAANRGGYFIQAMQELNDTNRSGILASVNGLTDGGSTPLAETLYEATQFYRGGTVQFGNSTQPGQNVNGVLTAPGGNTYQTPITQQCGDQSNNIVLLTDGEPTHDTDADNLIEGLPGFETTTGAASCTGNCLDELAKYLHNHDLSTIDGDQTVTTYTIGFTTNQQLLSDTAANGGGSYYTTDTTTGLAAALSGILNDIGSGSRGSFVSPAVGVDAFNRTSHRNFLYFALFQNNGERIWDGNIKPYKLGGNPPRIVDNNGDTVLDNNGQFVATSQSLWSTAADGAQITDGGANDHIPAPNARTLYTKATNSTGTLTALSAADPTLFGLTTGQTTERDAYVATALASKIADPLHSQPVVVNYGGTEAAPDISLFFGSNAGFLHAIDATTGIEEFAYVPRDLLATNVTQLGKPGSHLYGLDGSPVIWMDDTNSNGVVDTGEHVYAYIGMRRGGNNYYALDVTNRSAPELMWAIEGGSSDFTELGQTWSKPVLAKMLHNGTVTKVLIFAGGYDTNQDDYIPSTTDTQGRAIYIVNALTGARLWWAGPDGSGANAQVTDFTHSIPSGVRVIDSDRDGYADRLYVGDMGGQVFRVDLADSSGITGTVTTLASLGSASPNNRRFYYAPDVALTQTAPGAPLYYSVNIGSGYRAHPKDLGDATTTPPRTATDDRFYVIKDYHVHDSNFSGVTAITESAMLDVTSNDIGAATGITQQDAIDALNNAANRGWYIRLTAPGEKVLAESLTINGTLYFTTYLPPTSAGTGCQPPLGNGRLYKVSLFDATPVAANRYIELDQDGIPPAPTLVFVPAPPVDPTCTSNCLPPDDPTPTVCTGPQCDPDPVEVMMYRSYWRQQ